MHSKPRTSLVSRTQPLKLEPIQCIVLMSVSLFVLASFLSISRIVGIYVIIKIELNKC